MTELHNPLFEEEKEFLERKKLEYERALRGDVEHLKDQSVMVGKVALVGAGLAGGIWLITKAFSSKKRKRHEHNDHLDQDQDQDQEDHDYEFGAQYFTAGNGKRYLSKQYRKSAQDSASAFIDDAAGPADYADFAGAYPTEEEDPFQDLPYDDSRRLPISHAFDGDADSDEPAEHRPSLAGSVLQNFLMSDTGKVLVAQVAAVVLALVTKKLSEFFPDAKNADLATSPGYAPTETGFIPVASPASSAPSDASLHPQSI
jgi:hypothetical protein